MYLNLRAEMARKKITNRDIADLLQIDITTVSAKLNKKGRLKYQEAEKIRNNLFPSLSNDYLFAYEDEFDETNVKRHIK
jgi:transcriptional regulator with XRE-family HTH domain